MSDPPPASGVVPGTLLRDARIMTLVGTGFFLNSFYLLAVPPLFPMMKETFDTTYAALGAVMTAYSLATSASQMPFGFLVDRYGTHWVLMAGVFVFCGAFALSGLSSSYVMFLVLMILAGAANGVFQPANYTILASRIEPQRLGRAFGAYTVFGYVGFIFAPATMVLLEHSFGWRVAIGAAGCAGFAVVLAMAYWRSDLALVKTAAASPAAARSAGWGFLLAPAILLFLVFNTFLLINGSAVRNFLVTAVVMISDTPLSVANASLTGYYVASSIGVLVSGFVCDRTNRYELVVAGGMFVGVLAFVAIGVLPRGVIVVAMLLAGFMHGFVRTPRDLMVRAATPNHALGKVFAFISTGGNVTSAFVPWILGWMIDIGEPHGVLWFIAVFMGLTVIMMLAGRRIMVPPVR